MGKRILAALLLFFTIAAVSGTAMAKPKPHPTCPPNTPNAGGQPPCGNANGYPPKPIITIDCLKIFGDLTVGTIPNVKIGGHVTLLSPPGCILGGRLVILAVLSQRYVIGQGTTLEDGSLRIDGTMPSNIASGTHNLELDVAGKAPAVRAISVVPSLDSVPAAAHDGGRSGTGLAMLALWALLIVGGGAILATFGWRRVRAAPAGGGFGRRGRADAVVPHIDTSDFIPLKPTARPSEETED